VGSLTGPGPSPKIGLLVISGSEGVGSSTGPSPKIGFQVKIGGREGIKSVIGQ
jgi:hypothetical protein